MFPRAFVRTFGCDKPSQVIILMGPCIDCTSRFCTVAVPSFGLGPDDDDAFRRSSERKASAPGRQNWYAWVPDADGADCSGHWQPLRWNELRVADASRCAEATGCDFTKLCRSYNAGRYVPTTSTQSIVAASFS